MTQPGHPWAHYLTALGLLQKAPHLKGAVLRMRPGPVWEAALVELQARFPDLRRWPASFAISDLTGGLDSVATLAAGRAIYAKGLLQGDAPILIPSAERLSPQAAAIIAQAMDAGKAPPIILIDESADAEEHVPATLTDRLPFLCALDGLSMHDLGPCDGESTADLDGPCDAAEVLARLALRFGITGLRPPMLALSVAHTLGGQARDVAQAADMVLVPRAVQWPEDASDQMPDQPQDAPDTADGDSSETPMDALLDDIIVDAARAVLPDILARNAAFKNQAARAAHGFSGTGTKRRGNRRGRPLPAQAGRLDGQTRLDLVATLRAAVPWQPLRRKEYPHRTGIILSPRDIHVQRMEERSDRVLVFTVDASGSSAVARLGEAKGAIELVLAQAYAKRDHVSLVAFRKDGAETLLPPTRSLVQAKRRLAALPGGGATPLAAGLDAGMRQAVAARARGLTPQVILMTDGRGNVAIDGSVNRGLAAEDAQRIARHVAAQEIDALVIDTGARPQGKLAELARDMAADYVPLPRADAARISDLVVGGR